METNIIAQLATQFGAPGLLIGYMVWDRLLRRKDELAERDQDLALAASHRAEDMAMKRERIESDKALAAALATLTVTVQQMEHK